MIERVFHFEADMSLVAEQVLWPVVAEERDALAFFEYESTNGIADLVFAWFDESVVIERGAGPFAPPFVNAVEVALLRTLRDVAEPTAAVAERAGISPSTARRTLRSLAERDAAVRHRQGWSRVAPFRSRLRRAVAVELKLGAWRRALNQAARYLAFADASVVAVDARRVGPARKHAGAFGLNGVGLVAMSAWGEAETVVPAPMLPPRDDIARSVAGERLWLKMGQLATPVSLGQ